MSNGFIVSQIIRSCVVGITEAISCGLPQNAKPYLKTLRDLAEELEVPNFKNCQHLSTIREGDFWQRCSVCGKTKADDEEVWRD